MEENEEYGHEDGEEYYQAGDHDGDYSTGEGGWGEIAVAPIFTADHHDMVNTLRFDAAEESLWVGTASGTIVQSLPPALERFATITAHSDPILAMQSMGEACISLSPSQLSLTCSGCVPRVCYSDTIGDLAAVEFEHRGHRVLLGRSGGGLTSFDLVTGRPGGTMPTGDKGVVALCGQLAHGSIVMATADGAISLLDARNALRPGAALRAHTGGFAALDASGDLIATAGYSGGRLGMGGIRLEQSVKIFDVRMGLRMFSNIPFAPGPNMVRFCPGYTTTLLIGSASGLFSLVDAGAGIGAGDVMGVDGGGDPLVCCDISPSGECIAFGGAGGYVHLWATRDEPAASIGGAQPLGVTGTATKDPPPLTEDEPFTKVFMQYYSPDGGPLVSDIGPKEAIKVGLPPRCVDKTLLASGKRSDFVTYIDNPKLVRGGKPGESAAAVAVLRNQRQLVQSERPDAETERAERAAARAAAGGVVLPGRYRRVAIKQQTGVKFEEFDFSYYNKTPFSGLENDLANCYMNAFLQVLFFCRPMRDLAMTHAPDPHLEFSLMGELSLLFRMLATANDGTVCQAANLLRALRQNKEALALGLLEGVRGERGSADIEVEAQKDRSVARRTQRLSRFLMEQLSKETSSPSTPDQHSQQAPVSCIDNNWTSMERIFAIAQRQRTRCLSRERPDQEKLTRAFQVDLQYPPPKERPMNSIDAGAGPLSGTRESQTTAAVPTHTQTPRRPSFSDILADSLHIVADMRAWFDAEVSYQHVRQERVPTVLPAVLVVNCGMEDRGDLAWWAPVPDPEQERAPDAVNTHGQGEDPAEAPKRLHKMHGWLPLAVGVCVDPENWDVTVVEGATAAEVESKLSESAHTAGPPRVLQGIYELTAVIAHVMDEDEAAVGGAEYEGHLLAHIKVPHQYYKAQHESPIVSRTASRTSHREEGAQGTTTPEAASGQLFTDSIAPASLQLAASESHVKFSWLLFNDFHITPCLASDVPQLYGGQKVPVLLFFTRQEELKAAAAIPPAPPTPVLDADGFLKLCRSPPLQPNKSRLQRPTFVPLNRDEIPVPGQLFALDAEFVAYSPPERVMRRGAEAEIRPSRLGLGRVSVVRGQGPGRGVPCIDDYIRSVEPVYDHLTRFSGLVPGDLDPSHSRHYLTTLRCAYLKLRYLLDAGVIFVGHGLKKDFRMLNIAVPQEQIVDTIDLFYRGRGRRLSLRFLSSYLLGSHIQGEVHDSVEDAVAALKLYEMHTKLVQEGTFEARLVEMFDWGQRFGFEPSGWQEQPPHLITAAGRGGGGGGGGGASSAEYDATRQQEQRSPHLASVAAAGAIADAATLQQQQQQLRHRQAIQLLALQEQLQQQGRHQQQQQLASVESIGHQLQAQRLAEALRLQLQQQPQQQGREVQHPLTRPPGPWPELH